MKNDNKDSNETKKKGGLKISPKKVEDIKRQEGTYHPK
jgi:hypothetical protein